MVAISLQEGNKMSKGSIFFSTGFPSTRWNGLFSRSQHRYQMHHCMEYRNSVAFGAKLASPSLFVVCSSNLSMAIWWYMILQTYQWQYDSSNLLHTWPCRILLEDWRPLFPSVSRTTWWYMILQTSGPPLCMWFNKFMNAWPDWSDSGGQKA